MSTPTPLQSFVGGASLAIPVYTLLVLNGSVFGISGFLHRAVRGQGSAMVAVFGLIFGGVAVGLVEGAAPSALPLSLPTLVVSGLLVGMGSKLSNGCTSGHMIAGFSRFSLRSITATAMFFVSGIPATYFVHGNTLLPSGPLDWSLGKCSAQLLALQTLPIFVSVLLYLFTPKHITPMEEKMPSETTSLRTASVINPKAHKNLRLIALLTTSFSFAIALRFSNLSDQARVLGFLAMPWSKAFDPSLAFLAAGALPLSILLYRYGRGKSEQPRFGGDWNVPKGGKVDVKLVGGAALFGIGWGIAGICPGPALVNLGRIIANGGDILGVAAWIAATVTGGLLV